MFNATNTRNFGIPEGRINSANFLNEKGTDGGNRRDLALRPLHLLGARAHPPAPGFGLGAFFVLEGRV